MQLVFIAHRRGAAFEIADARAVVGDDERALELAGLGGVDAEIGRKLHRTAHAFRDVAERTVGEHGGIQRGVIVVRVRHDRAEIFFDEVGMVMNRLAERAENNSLLRQIFAIRRADGNGIKNRVHRHAGQPAAFAQRNAELLVGFQQVSGQLRPGFSARRLSAWAGKNS